MIKATFLYMMCKIVCERSVKLIVDYSAEWFKGGEGGFCTFVFFAI